MGGTFHVTVSSPADGQNIFAGQPWAKSKTNQRIVAISCVGGSDELDGHFEISYGSDKVIDIWNTHDGDIGMHGDDRTLGS